MTVLATGEPHALLSLDLLESAASSPQNHFHYGEEKDVLVLGVRLLFSVAKNHAFEQGNKRTAFTAFVEFLDINGYGFYHPDEEFLGQLVVSLLEGRVSLGEFEAIIGGCVHPHTEG